MQIKVGGVYKTRNGETITITTATPNEEYEFRADNFVGYTTEGKYIKNTTAEYAQDIVEEVITVLEDVLVETTEPMPTPAPIEECIFPDEPKEDINEFDLLRALKLQFDRLDQRERDAALSYLTVYYNGAL